MHSSSRAGHSYNALKYTEVQQQWALFQGGGRITGIPRCQQIKVLARGHLGCTGMASSASSECAPVRLDDGSKLASHSVCCAHELKTLFSGSHSLTGLQKSYHRWVLPLIQENKKCQQFESREGKPIVSAEAISVSLTTEHRKRGTGHSLKMVQKPPFPHIRHKPDFGTYHMRAATPRILLNTCI